MGKKLVRSANEICGSGSGGSSSTPLSAGTISAAAASSSSIVVSQATAPSGGVGAITTALYRHTSASFTPPGTGTNISTSLPKTDTGLSADTPYYYRRLVTDGASATDLSAEVTATTDESGDEPAPSLLEDFSTYTNTADMLADPRGIISESEDSNPSKIILDTAVGYDVLTQSMRFDFPDRTVGGCSDYTIGRNYQIGGNRTEIWIRCIFKFQSNWEAYPSWYATCVPARNPDYKLLFARMSETSRWEVLFGNSVNKNMIGGFPTSQTEYNMGGIGSKLTDDSWHTLKLHLKCSTASAGLFRLALDGVTRKDQSGITTTASPTNLINGIAIGRNYNVGPGQAQSIWWGKLEVWYPGNDPGWTW